MGFFLWDERNLGVINLLHELFKNELLFDFDLLLDGVSSEKLLVLPYHSNQPFNLVFMLFTHILVAFHFEV